MHIIYYIDRDGSRVNVLLRLPSQTRRTVLLDTTVNIDSKTYFRSVDCMYLTVGDFITRGWKAKKVNLCS